MAKRMIFRYARAVLLMGSCWQLTACVSTEELYAEYDARQCVLVVEKEVDGSLTLRELVSNTHFPWEPAVYFDFDSHTLDEQNRALLAGAVEVMKRYPQLNLSLQGFSDRIGTRQYNLALANKRVAAVRNVFVAAGLEPSRVVDQPLGEGLSQFGDDDDLSRSINRRVELMLLDELGRPLHPLFNFDGL